ncbi:fasciclin domain-containing protein [Aestuariibaculum sediminum]|uniref:Fasciclin domain-containing protein n=1 Tax=Aestuariibaculum sediminum TaxID=2770637 RepID=A0A8J6Q7Z8_9FLAO|nr:fasciclin domain-containing protein [Aestuariibaculum sediminum]MBD0832190.1 fasciclin domain-containing protein [Aestuariibaculum sediminum]
MKKRIRYYLLFSLLVFFLASCSKKEVDEYYARPDNLEPPIYQQLEAQGNFTNLLTLIDLAGYKDILGKAGYWTMMAPNDDAFNAYFQAQGISDVSSIDSLTASKIVKYALIYNAFRTERLSDFQSNIGWEEDLAFRRRTAYYDGFQEKVIDGTPTIVVGSNRNNVEGGDYYISGDNNNKYVTYFTEEYMSAASLGSYDYNYFFPNSTYTGFNVMSSEVVKADIVAENGIIHEVNRVTLPPLNLDQKIEGSPNYSLFYKLLNDNLITYSFDQEATTTYQNYTQSSEDVYVKVYDPTLSFSPNNENFLKVTDNDGQSDGYTLIVPENSVLQGFIDEVLLKNYSALDKLPIYVFQDFINAHMIQAAVWPSKVTGYSNALEEDIRIDMDNDVVEAELLSNGFFYGTNKIQASNLFFSVYTSAYLDPDFTLATRLFNDGSGYREIASNIYRNYTLFLPSDEVLMGLGFDYDINRSEWVYNSPETGNEVRGSLARARIARVLYNGIVPTPNMEMNDLSGSGIIRSGDFDLPGEYIKWESNQVYAAGNEVLGNRVNILGYEDQQNGRTYYIDNILEFSEEFQGVDLAELATEAGSQYEYFYEYLKSSGLYDEASGAIDGVELGTPFTFVIPSNDAIMQAVMDGVLPGDAVTGVPNFTPANDTEREGIANFVKYHFLATRTASDDGLINGLTETLLKTEFGEKTYVNIVSAPGDLSFVDAGNRVANYIPLESNHLADRTLIHLVDNYLLYTE